MAGILTEEWHYPLMRTRLALTTVALCGAPWLLGAPAQAAPTDCKTSGLGGTSAYFPSSLAALGANGCFIGDKVYSDFIFDASVPASSLWTLTTSGATHTLSATGLNFNAPGSFSYSYNVSLYNAVPGQELVKFNTDASGSGGTLTYTKTLLATPPGSASNSSQAAPGNIVFFPSGSTGPIAFSSTVTVTTGKLDNLTDSLDQKINETATTPGPLPLLGAGAAFGFSRKIRRRSRQLA